MRLTATFAAVALAVTGFAATANVTPAYADPGNTTPLLSEDDYIPITDYANTPIVQVWVFNQGTSTYTEMTKTLLINKNLVLLPYNPDDRTYVTPVGAPAPTGDSNVASVINLSGQQVALKLKNPLTTGVKSATLNNYNVKNALFRDCTIDSYSNPPLHTAPLADCAPKPLSGDSLRVTSYSFDQEKSLDVSIKLIKVRSDEPMIAYLKGGQRFESIPNRPLYNNVLNVDKNLYNTLRSKGLVTAPWNSDYDLWPMPDKWPNSATKIAGQGGPWVTVIRTDADGGYDSKRAYQGVLVADKKVLVSSASYRQDDSATWKVVPNSQADLTAILEERGAISATASGLNALAFLTDQTGVAPMLLLTLASSIPNATPIEIANYDFSRKYFADCVPKWEGTWKDCPASKNLQAEVYGWIAQTKFMSVPHYQNYKQLPVWAKSTSPLYYYNYNYSGNDPCVSVAVDTYPASSGNFITYDGKLIGILDWGDDEETTRADYYVHKQFYEAAAAAGITSKQWDSSYDNANMHVTMASKYGNGDDWLEKYRQDLDEQAKALELKRAEEFAKAQKEISKKLTVIVEAEKKPAVPAANPPREEKRVAGENRVETSVAAFNNYFPTATEVVIATGKNYPDGLAATTLAQSLGTGVMLSNANAGQGIEPSILASLKAKHVRTINLVGGDGVIPQSVEASLKAQGFTVKRFAGKTRYETAAKIAAATVANRGESPQTYYVVSGQNFPDALAAGPVAAKTNGVLVMAEEITPALRAKMNDAFTVCVGGPACRTIGNADRQVVGQDRYATARMLTAFYPEGNCSNAVVASGTNFADALSAGPIAASANKCMLLTDGKALTSPKSVKNITVFGGRSAVNLNSFWNR